MSPNSSSQVNIQYSNDYGIKKFPRHLAIIPDGNRRWARENDIPVLKAHYIAMKALIPRLVELLKSTDIEVITLWALSTENLGRTPGEVNAIYDSLLSFIPKFLPVCHEFKAQLCRIGSSVGFPEEVLDLFEDAKKETEMYTVRKVNIALNYGGRNDILEAVNQLIENNPPGKVINIEDINRWVCMGGDKHPEPELIIRTGADSTCFRTSGFLTWQGMDANYYFINKLSPVVTLDDFFVVFREYEDLIIGGNRKSAIKF